MFEKDDRSVLGNKGFLLGDIIALELGLLISCLLKVWGGEQLYTPYYILLGIGIACISVLFAFAGEPYKAIKKRGLFLELTSSSSFVAIIFMTCLSIFFVMKVGVTFSREVILIWFAVSLVLVFASRLLTKRYWKKGEQLKKNLIIITQESMLEKTAERIPALEENYDIVALGMRFSATKSLDGYTCLYGKEQIVEYALAHVVDEVLIINMPIFDRLDETMDDLLEMGIVVHFDVARLFNNLPPHRPYLLTDLSGRKVVTMSMNELSEWDRTVKRTMDLAGALVGLVLTGLVTIVVGPMIYFSSPGNIIFKQDRVGRNGRIFKFYKFRSMYMDAEERKKELMKHNEMQGLMFKMENDPRITPIGKFIRKTSIDELPQFWNVLKGDMSLVGTRPPTVDEYEHYQKHHKIRLAMRPGITGMWQVEGRSDIIDFEEVVELDKKYLNEWTLGLDIKLILKTVLVVLKKRGAK